MDNKILEQSAEESDRSSNPPDNRENPRLEFAYPIKFSMFCPSLESMTFNGYIKNISMSGAGLECKDRYGRFNIDKMKNSRMRLEINVPQGNQIVLFGSVRWIKRQAVGQGYFICMGLEFIDVEDWQIEQIERFMDLRNKDHKMMWNLWEDYLQQTTG